MVMVLVAFYLKAILIGLYRGVDFSEQIFVVLIHSLKLVLLHRKHLSSLYGVMQLKKLYGCHFRTETFMKSGKILVIKIRLFCSCGTALTSDCDPTPTYCSHFYRK